MEQNTIPPKTWLLWDKFLPNHFCLQQDANKSKSKTICVKTHIEALKIISFQSVKVIVTCRKQQAQHWKEQPSKP